MKKESTVKKIISEDTKFKLPVKIKKVIYRGKIFVISPETANWIILENEEQWQFFQLLTSLDLGKALKRFVGTYENAQYTVMQIVAKHFENQFVKPKNDGGSMQMYLTNECNMRCPHCYMFAGLKKRPRTFYKGNFRHHKFFQETWRKQYSFLWWRNCTKNRPVRNTKIFL